MPIVDIFSKRQRRIRGEIDDVYSYDDFPECLRVQVVHLWYDAIGNKLQYKVNDNARRVYHSIASTLRIEYGVFLLPNAAEYHDDFEQLVNFMLVEDDIEHVLDAVELSFRAIVEWTTSWDYLHRDNAQHIADAAVTELNARFKEHGVGYQFVEQQIIRIDSEFVHSEIVKPALRLLHDYAGAQEEFLKAHQHYRKGNIKEALSECLKALESVMKAICDKRKWSYNSVHATASTLIDICLKNDLIPSFWQSHYSSLRSVLESGVPTGRNRQGGHGQGTQPVSVPDHIAAYMLHMTASAIVFLAEAECQLP